MRATTITLFLACHLAVAHNGQAIEFPEDYTRLLIPVTAIAVTGAYGSVWTTEWAMYNGSGENLYVIGPFPYLYLSPPVQDNTVDLGATKRLILNEAAPGFDGAFVYVPTADVETLPMSLRVRDTSVNSQSYGTSIPIIRPAGFKPTVHLIDVPTDPAYRTMLRIYGIGPEPQVVRLEIYTPDGRSPIEQRDVVLHVHERVGLEEVPRPTYAQLDPLSDSVRNAGQKVRLAISVSESDAATRPVWAFVSISHNQTQQVTTVVP
ncbi:MAG TPA: hypothetical protein VGQ36_08585 [Thermoanaerobaculia bacterium]|jgi:hypothetical protein|nr:hypothetical protein [Thermoanaerobaculia bacterium]